MTECSESRSSGGSARSPRPPARGTKPGYAPHAYSVAPGDLVNGITASGPLTISGGIVIGTPLTCAAPTHTLASGATLDSTGSTATAADNGTLTYAWFQDDGLIAGETSATYTIRPEDENHDLRCDVTPPRRCTCRSPSRPRRTTSRAESTRASDG